LHAKSQHSRFYRFRDLSVHTDEQTDKQAETIQATILGLGMQIPEVPAQRKYVSAECHAYYDSNAHKPPKLVAPTIFMLGPSNFY